VPDLFDLVAQPMGSIDLLTAQAGTRAGPIGAASWASRVPADRRRRGRRRCPYQLPGRRATARARKGPAPDLPWRLAGRTASWGFNSVSWGFKSVARSSEPVCGCGCGAGTPGQQREEVTVLSRWSSTGRRLPQSGPGLRLRSGWPLSSFPQVTCLDRSGGPALAPHFACGSRARPALVVL